MDTNELNAPPRAKSRVRRAATRSGGGVRHEKFRHRDGFTVVGNHLSQHLELSLVALGLGLHIQSLPDGEIVAIKFLAARFDDSEARIAAGLRELEAAGYLSRDRVRLPNGQIVTHTVFRDKPDAPLAEQAPRAPRKPRAPRPAVRRPRPDRVAATVPPHPAPPSCDELPPLWAGFDEEFAAQEPEPGPDTYPHPEPHPDPDPERAPAPALAPAPTPKAPAPRPPSRPLPEPRTFDPERDHVARDLLHSLRLDDPRLTLADRDVERLGPAVATWLERKVAPDAVRQALTVKLPEHPHSPAGLIAHRLTANMPGPLPAAPPPAARPDPFQDCDGCGRVFRAPQPGACRECRAETEGLPRYA